MPKLLPMLRFTFALGLGTLLALPSRGEDHAGVFVAVGYGGRRLSSLDGQTWEHDQRWSEVAADDDNVLFDVAFGHDRFIAVGGGARIGHLLSSRDGRTWRELPQRQGRVATIAFGNGRFVSGHDAELLYSSDGEHFAAGERLDWKGSVHARRSACGDTEAGFAFVIIGDVDLWAEKKRLHWRATTGDGTTYRHRIWDTPPAQDIAYGAGHFVTVGPGGLIESSHDGQTWKRHAVRSDENFSRVVWTGQRFLVSGGRTAWSSPDALTWRAESNAIPGSLAWAQEGWLGLGLGWGGHILTSGDFLQWKKATLPPGPALEAVAFGRLPER